MHQSVSGCLSQPSFELTLGTFQNTKIIASGPITSRQIDRETMETLTDFIFSGKITEDGYCSLEIKRLLFLGRKGMTNLDSILKRRDSTLDYNKES